MIGEERGVSPIAVTRPLVTIISQIVSDNSARPTRPGHTAERIGYFTDAVFAIAMTLLVIEIPRPNSPDYRVGGGTSKTEAVDGLWHFLTAQSAAFRRPGPDPRILPPCQ